MVVNLGTCQVSQSVLSAVDDADRSEALRIALFSCRIFIYAFCMMKMIFDQIRMFCADCRGGYVERYCRIPIPHYLQEWQGLGGLILLWLLIIMATQEPMFWCLGGDETLFTTACAEGLARRRIYSVFSSPLPELVSWLRVSRRSRHRWQPEGPYFMEAAEQPFQPSNHVFG